MSEFISNTERMIIRQVVVKAVCELFSMRDFTQEELEKLAKFWEKYILEGLNE